MVTHHADNDEQTHVLRLRLAEAEEMVRAIQQGEVDALVVEGAAGNQVYTLRSAEEPYRNLVEQMHEGAVVLTSRGDILYSNARFAELVGEPLESVVGSHVNRFVSASDRDEFDTLLHIGSGRCRSSLIGPLSVAFEVSVSLTTTVEANGGRLNLIVTDLRELLEAKSNRDRAERENHTKDEFLATMAHELRNPLSAISAALGVLEFAHAAGGPATRAHEIIGRQVKHISTLINDLLDVERLVSGKIRMDRQPMDMGEAVQRAVATATGNAPLDRYIDISTEPVWVEGDAQRVEQVVTNIVVNAIKYTPPGGQIRVTLRADEGDAVLVVEDTGAGISPALLPSIFERYVQADRTLDCARGGLGIGLSLVRRLVELHGGTVDASSDGEGLGSRFTVRMRSIPAAHTSVRVAVAFTQDRPVTPKRVLLLEDSGEARERLRSSLELAGHVVYDAADADGALALVNVVHPDVGIIDVGLATEGYQVARQIREGSQGREMLLLALSGYGSPDQSLAHVFDHHLVKPVDPDRLARLIGEGVEAIEGL
jgi:signal transduction histidine kinase